MAEQYVQVRLEFELEEEVSHISQPETTGVICSWRIVNNFIPEYLVAFSKDDIDWYPENQLK